jgi:hypothetical protein
VGTAGQLARAGASLCIPSGSGPIVAPVVDNFQLSASNLRAVGYGKARLKNKAAPLLSRTVASKSSTSRPRLRPDVEAGSRASGEARKNSTATRP